MVVGPVIFTKASPLPLSLSLSSIFFLPSTSSLPRPAHGPFDRLPHVPPDTTDQNQPPSNLSAKPHRTRTGLKVGVTSVPPSPSFIEPRSRFPFELVVGRMIEESSIIRFRDNSTILQMFFFFQNCLNLLSDT